MLLSTNVLTKGAILVSINTILFFLSKSFDVANLTLLTITSVITCLSIIKFKIKPTILIIISSSISAAILGFVEYSLAYFLFFGSYPIFKFYVEILNNVLVEIFLKLVYFYILFVFILFVFIKVFLQVPMDSSLLILAFVVSPIIFIMYDIFLTKLIKFIYHNTLIRKL